VGRYDGDSGSGGGVRGGQAGQGLGTEQGHVAVRHQDRAGRLGDRLERALDRPAGAWDVVLVHDEHTGVDGADLGGDQVPAVADDDHELLRRDPSRGSDGMPDQAAATDPVENLGSR
jgi:hypothetical protein